MADLKQVLFLWLALLLAVTNCAPVLLRDASSPLKRAGPSGSVVAPAGGTQVLNLGGTGSIYVEYQGVQGTTDDGNTYQTIGIDVSLHDPSGFSTDATLAQGFKPNPTSGVHISGYFAPPLGACGTFNLVITEHQLTNQHVITFQAAAPEITIQCGPIQ
ncbi:hypothetical protein CALCODRAFT_485122 [Calocera cornea HHB12733]|uniref:Uncharacterized protein n=1 Tax=Calocera cornea HHB12733 TaxID=1353952 RepID=A0A165EJ75_9BASI|nr:hypothetical protein CALCODRAFT_485122 [Calocera cornea HHB12733]